MTDGETTGPRATAGPVAGDDSLATDELLAGAGTAAIAALPAEAACHQAALLFRVRLAWLLPALRLPGQIAVDTVTVYRVLSRLAHERQA